MSYADRETARQAKHADYVANAEAYKARARRWREANADRVRENDQRYAEANKDRKREYDRKYRSANAERKRENDRRYYGRSDKSRWSKLQVLRREITARVWHEQGGLCYLCERPVALGAAVLEHDHRCCPKMQFCAVCIRGVACRHCNTSIGLANDDPDQLERMAANLRAAKTAAARRLAAMPEQPGLWDDADAAAAVEALPAPRRLRAVSDSEGR